MPVLIGIPFAFLGCGQANEGQVPPTFEQAAALESDAEEDTLADEPVGTAVWEQKAAAGPTGATGALAYDSARGKLVYFGGEAETWEWDGSSWERKNPTISPARRSSHGLVFDAARGKVLLFGGAYTMNYMNDTWEWDGTSWERRLPDDSPSQRGGLALAYDDTRGKAVLFGGKPLVGAPFADTWEWDGTNWEQIEPQGSSPPGRLYHALAYDRARHRVVLFGGYDWSQNKDLNDTWEWDGTKWEKKESANPPPARSAHALVYDAARGKVVLFGGYARAASSVLNDTWEWDGVSWKEVHPETRPSAREYHALAYDSAKRRVVLFGGLVGNDGVDDAFWEYHVFGNGCASDEQCDTGHCVDGVCCQTACGKGEVGKCTACSVAAGAEVDGICVTFSGNACDDGDPCTVGDVCHEGACEGTPMICEPEACEEHVGCDPNLGCLYARKPAGTVCRAAACDHGQAIAEGTCDGTSVTCPVPEVTSCGLYVCGEDACLSACESDEDCAEGAICAGGSCVVEDADAGVDGGDEGDAGDGEDAGSDAGDDQDAGGNADGGRAIDAGDEGGDGISSEQEDSGCSCRAVGGHAKGHHAAWLGLGLAALAMTRRRKV